MKKTAVKTNRLKKETNPFLSRWSLQFHPKYHERLILLFLENQVLDADSLIHH